MITQYDPELAVVDSEWLNRVGTAYAHAYYTHECLKISQKMSEEAQKVEQIKALFNDENDPDGVLETHLELLDSTRNADLWNQLKIAENRLAAINGHEWVDGIKTSEAVEEASLGEIGNPTLITREEFENGWQKAEAGY